MTADEMIKAVDEGAKQEAAEVFSNIFASQVVGRRLHQDAIDNCISSLGLLNIFQDEVTKRITEKFGSAS